MPLYLTCAEGFCVGSPQKVVSDVWLPDSTLGRTKDKAHSFVEPCYFVGLFNELYEGFEEG